MKKITKLDLEGASRKFDVLSENEQRGYIGRNMPNDSLPNCTILTVAKIASTGYRGVLSYATDSLHCQYGQDTTTGNWIIETRLDTVYGKNDKPGDIYFHFLSGTPYGGNNKIVRDSVPGDYDISGNEMGIIWGSSGTKGHAIQILSRNSNGTLRIWDVNTGERNISPSEVRRFYDSE